MNGCRQSLLLLAYLATLRTYIRVRRSAFVLLLHEFSIIDDSSGVVNTTMAGGHTMTTGLYVRFGRYRVEGKEYLASYVQLSCQTIRRLDNNAILQLSRD